MRRLLLAFAVSLIAAPSLALPAFAADDPVVAKVNGAEIRKSEVDAATRQLPPQVRQAGLDKFYPQLLEELIGKKLLTTKAYAENTANRDDVKRAVKAATDDIVAEAYVNKVVDGQITEDKLKARYNELVAKMPKGEEINARHILVESEAKAKELIAKIKAGGDFAKLAQENSKDTGSAKDGGSLGWFRDKDMVPEFSKAAFAMKKGEVSAAPVKTQFGYHIIRVEDRRPAQAPAYDAVKPRIEQQVGNELARDYLRGLIRTAKVERFSLDGKTPMAAPAETAVTQ